jgi:hypothetical protein
MVINNPLLHMFVEYPAACWHDALSHRVVLRMREEQELATMTPICDLQPLPFSNNYSIMLGSGTIAAVFHHPLIAPFGAASSFVDMSDTIY